MATMIDQKSSLKYYGEKEVWQYFHDLLPKDIVIYNSREILGREFDFCLLIENKGILIVEVKGWDPKKGIIVESPDRIFLGGEEKTYPSPKKQARGYKFNIKEYLEKRDEISPLIMDMVCYPFISREEFYQLRLDIVSEEENTILFDDFQNPQYLMNKINKAYDLLKSSCHAYMSSEKMITIRQMFEPHLFLAEKDLTINPYSSLSVFTDEVEECNIKNIISNYALGTKQIVFLQNRNAYKKIIESINEFQKEKNISIGPNKVVLGYTENSRISPEGMYTNIFNFQVYLCDQLNLICKECIQIDEGQFSEQEYEYLEKLSKCTEFNLHQYEIEHADAGSNVLVEAGAGTGKTYSMVSRVAYLTNKMNEPMLDIVKDLAMITFTNAAADNMKSRLKQMFKNYFILTNNSKYLGLIEDVDKSQISTIHKFVINLLRSNPVYTGLGVNFKISTDKYMRENIYDNKLSEYIEKTNCGDKIRQMSIAVYELRKTLMNFADVLLQKNISISNINDLYYGSPQNNVIDNMNELIDNVIIPAEKEYNNTMLYENKIDLSSVIVTLNDILRNYNEQLFSLNYRYIFIDEFQDTDDVQIELFKSIQKKIGKQCTFFIVGDLKQSIYRFRGATISAFDLMKKGTLNGWKEYILNKNYRTDQKLLNKLNIVFSNLDDQNLLKYDDKDQLNSNIYDEIRDKTFFEVETDIKNKSAFYDDLASVINEQVSILMSNKEYADSKGKNYKTIALLTRSNWEVANIKKELAKRNIKVEVESTGNLYQLESTLDLYRLLQALIFNKDNESLVAFIESNYIKLNIDYQKMYLLDQSQIQKLLYDQLNTYFKDVMGCSFEEIINEVYTKPILYILKRIYDGLKPWRQYTNYETKRKLYRDNYAYLLERIVKYFNVDNLTINQIFEYLRINIMTGQLYPSRENKTEEDGIKIIASTVHKSKGLEYGTVILPFTNFNLSNDTKKGVVASVTHNELAYKIRFRNKISEYNSNFDQDEEAIDQLQDESRILYVALTRAMRNCIWFKTAENPESCWANMLGE